MRENSKASVERVVGLRLICGRCGRESGPFVVDGVTFTHSQIARAANQARAAGWRSLTVIREGDPSRRREWACPRCSPIIKRRPIDVKRWRWPR